MANNTLFTVRGKNESCQRSFKKAFDLLNNHEKNYVKAKIMTFSKRCSISNFYYKMRGDGPIYKKEYAHIESLFAKKYGINAWTGKKL